MISEIQYCLFPNLGIFRNMKITDVYQYSISGKAYRLKDVDAKTRKCLVMWVCVIKDMSKFHVFNNIMFHKYGPKQELNTLRILLAYCSTYIEI